MVGGISGWQLLILLLIVVLVFGTKRLRNIGSDLGSAVKGFRKGMDNEPEQQEPEQIEADAQSAQAQSHEEASEAASESTDSKAPATGLSTMAPIIAPIATIIRPPTINSTRKSIATPVCNHILCTKQWKSVNSGKY